MTLAATVVDTRVPLKLSENFGLAEFIATQNRKIDNALPVELLDNARQTCAMLERIRVFLCERLGEEVPIGLSSGYRCEALNRAVGGARGSDHVQALAADWNARKFGPAFKVAAALEPVAAQLGIGQLIQEFATCGGGGWVHTSVRAPAKGANRVITIDRFEGKARVRPGIHLPAA